MVVVNAFRNHRGRNQRVNHILKRLMAWQIQHQCRLEIEYVRSKENLADAPSRLMDYQDEICIRYLMIICPRFKKRFS